MCSIAAGCSRSYEWLFLSRVGIGAAEAGLYPVAVALAAAYFSRKHLPRALRSVLIGPFIGCGLAAIFCRPGIGAPRKGGPPVLPVVGAPPPWQLTFLMVITVVSPPTRLVLSVP